MSPLYKPPPAQFRRATGSIPPPRLPRVRVESAVPSGFLLDRLGIRSESDTPLPRIQGEIFSGQDGDFILRTVRVADPNGSHDEEVLQVNVGGVFVTLDPSSLEGVPGFQEPAQGARIGLAQTDPANESSTDFDPFEGSDSAQSGVENENTAPPPELQPAGEPTIVEGRDGIGLSF